MPAPAYPSLLTCKHCGGSFKRGKRGPAATYCSGSCRAAACVERAKADGRYDEWSERDRLRREARRPPRKPCPYCGEPVDHERRVQCGKPECERAFNRDRMRSYGFHGHRARARRYGVAYEAIDRARVFEEDDWVCGICGERTDPDADPKSPRSASLDHIIPMRRGGGHVRSNVQCAHLECNFRKGSRLDPADLR